MSIELKTRLGIFIVLYLKGVLLIFSDNLKFLENCGINSDLIWRGGRVPLRRKARVQFPMRDKCFYYLFRVCVLW